MTPIYIIDGYNVLHKIPELRALITQSLEAAREKLEQKLVSSLAIHKAKYILVYDGRDIQPRPPQRNVKGLKIIFSKVAHNADSIIKKQIRQSTLPNNTFVVSADQDLVLEAKAHHSNALSPRDFFQKLEEKNNELRFQQKYNDYTMSKKELAEWLKLFGEESDQSEGNREI